MIAITRAVPDTLDECELTHQARMPIDVVRARLEHEQYEQALRSLGCRIIRLPALHDHPDSVFVEDTAVVVDEVAVSTRPGALSRRAETETMRSALQDHRRVVEIVEPGTLDGGDVLRVGRRVFVGISTRTNAAGAGQLRTLLEPLGYSVTYIRVAQCLHLKSAVTALADDLILVNAAAVSPDLFGVASLSVPPAEPSAANVLAVERMVLCPAHATATAELLERTGFEVIAVDNTELAKAEAGLTCCSVLLPD